MNPANISPSSTAIAVQHDPSKKNRGTARRIPRGFILAKTPPEKLKKLRKKAVQHKFSSALVLASLLAFGTIGGAIFANNRLIGGTLLGISLGMGMIGGVNLYAQHRNAKKLRAEEKRFASSLARQLPRKRTRNQNMNIWGPGLRKFWHYKHLWQ